MRRETMQPSLPLLHVVFELQTQQHSVVQAMHNVFQTVYRLTMASVVVEEIF